MMMDRKNIWIWIGALLVALSLAIFLNLSPGHYFVATEYRRMLLSRLSVVLISIVAAGCAWRKRQDVTRVFKNFFLTPGPALNLAVFRIALFGYLFFILDEKKIIWFSQLPRDLIFAPFGTGWISQYLPINEMWAASACQLFRLFSFLAMLGVVTPLTSGLTAVIGVYVWGIPQLFGKVNHYHHLIWFAMILASSRSADVLSVDAIWASWKRADRGNVEPPASNTAYSLPLKMIWILIGLIYFFPGFWKVCEAGWDWALGENIKFQLYAKWHELGGWVPLFRVDQYPALYRLVGIGTIVFEISFIFLLFTRWRWYAVAAGLIFHNMTHFFMQIAFRELQFCYLSFVNWRAAFDSFSRRLDSLPSYLIYDGHCKICRRTIATLRTLEFGPNIIYVNAFDAKALAQYGLTWIDKQDLMKDMHFVQGPRVWKGYDAYRKIAARIPPLWLLWPFLYIWPVPFLGRMIYRWVADSRLCQIDYKPVEGGGPAAAAGWPQLTVMVGIFLIAGNVLVGFMQKSHAWPLVCYPTFAWISDDSVTTIEIEPENQNGEKIDLNKEVIMEKFGEARWHGLINKIVQIHDPVSLERRLRALWTVCVKSDPGLKEIRKINFYRVKVFTIPEAKANNLLSKELIYTLDL